MRDSRRPWRWLLLYGGRGRRRRFEAEAERLHYMCDIARQTGLETPSALVAPWWWCVLGL